MVREVVVCCTARGGWSGLLSLALLSLALLALGWGSGVAGAQPPQFRFDLDGAIACRDVTTAEFAALHPGERLVEALPRVSSLLVQGDEQRVLELLYRMESPHHGFEVVDYLPQTTLTTDVAGNIGLNRSDERTSSTALNLSAKYEQWLNASVAGGQGSKTSTQLRYELLPPLELLAASGTTRRGAGVFFKLRPSPRTSLEGARQFALVLRVPANWRGDCLWVRCEAATVNHNSLGFDSGVSRAATQFVAPLYLEGDDGARRAALRLVRCESDLRRLAVSRAGAIREHAYPAWHHKLGGALSLVEPKIPAGWLEQLVGAPAGADVDQLLRPLPTEVRRVAADYVAAKLSLRSLSGGEAVSLGRLPLE